MGSALLKEEQQRVVLAISKLFEEAVNVALNAEHNFKSARLGGSAGSAASSSPSRGPEPIHLSQAEEAADLFAAEQRADIRRCFMCGSTGTCGLVARCAARPMLRRVEAPLRIPSQFLDFDSVERCLVLDLDGRYGLILGMTWLESHEPWFDWKSKTLGPTRSFHSGALTSHEPTSAKRQKRYWRGHKAESAVVLDIGMSEMVSNEVAVGCDGAQGVAPPLLSGISRVDDPPLSVLYDTVPSLRSAGVLPPGPIDGGNVARPFSSSRARPRRERRRRRRAFMMSMTSDEMSTVSSGETPRDCSEQLYALVNGVTGDVDGDISLE
ncbi:reverse transcriptase [Phytophthora megakarya]|uniref:Reverse transcriptase n=1 Tax=Phytophthora megakarya TaxID=4795 RepID=A0A225WJQ7_9STRA|nr:reverse transcriptase [Phytophthora megakarya]